MAGSHCILYPPIPDPAITLADIEPTSIKLQWSLPSVLLNPAIQSLNQTVNITYAGPCPVEEIAEPSREIAVGGEVRMLELEDLEEFSEYSVTVSAEYPSDTISATITVTTTQAGMYLDIQISVLVAN